MAFLQEATFADGNECELEWPARTLFVRAKLQHRYDLSIFVTHSKQVSILTEAKLLHILEEIRGVDGDKSAVFLGLVHEEVCLLFSDHLRTKFVIL